MSIKKGLAALVHKILGAVDDVAHGGDVHCIVVDPVPAQKVFIFIVPEKDAGTIQTMLEIKTGSEPTELWRGNFYRK